MNQNSESKRFFFEHSNQVKSQSAYETRNSVEIGVKAIALQISIFRWNAEKSKIQIFRKSKSEGLFPHKWDNYNYYNGFIQ